jgi:hypothetical protein
MSRGAGGRREWSGKRAALIVAHPGHELRVHGWLELTRPRVFVLTDGSGRSGASRLEYTTRVLERAGAERGGVYGRFTDRALYAAILDGDAEVFLRLVDELAAALADGPFTDVVGDAAEGYNPVHDLCRVLINAAVLRVGGIRGPAIRNFDFSPIGAPGGPGGARSATTRLRLGGAALARKMAAARAYEPLRAEVREALTTEPPGTAASEVLSAVEEPAGRYRLAELPPYYERYGEQQVAGSHYAHVIRYREHVLPIADAIHAAAASPAGSRAGR